MMIPRHILPIIVIIGIQILSVLLIRASWPTISSTLRYEDGYQRVSSGGFVALSVDKTPSFFYFAPLAVEAWRRCEIEPVFVLVGNHTSWNTTTQSRLVLRYLEEQRVRVTHMDIEEHLPHTTAFLSTVGRLFVPNLVKPEDVLMMGDIDVLPFQCDYFRAMVKSLKANPYMHVYMDMPVDLELPRFAMCYIASKGKHWLEIVPPADSINSFLQAILSPESYKDVFFTGQNGKYAFPMDYDERYLGYHIKRLSCYPNCTSIINRSFSRNYKELVRGPLGPDYSWNTTLKSSGHNVFTHLSQLIEGHVGDGPFSLFEDAKKQDGVLFTMLKLYWEWEPLARVKNYSREFFQNG